MMRTIFRWAILYIKGYRYFTPCVHKTLEVSYCIHKNSKTKENVSYSNHITIFSTKAFEIISKNLIEEYIVE